MSEPWLAVLMLGLTLDVFLLWGDYAMAGVWINLSVALLEMEWSAPGAALFVLIAALFLWLWHSNDRGSDDDLDGLDLN